MTHQFGLQLGLRTLAILAIVAVSTAVLVAPELLAGSANVHAPLLAALALGHG